jgi:hypothetical protein
MFQNNARRWVLLVAIMIGSGGCISLQAANTPGPVDDQFIHLGMHRSEAEDILNAQAHEIAFGSGTFVQYRYEDHETYPWRVALYAPFGPADIIFAPIEALFQRAGQRWATGLYDREGRLVHFVSVDAGGNSVVEVGGASEPLRVIRRHTFLDAVLGPRYESTNNEGKYDEEI